MKFNEKLRVVRKTENCTQVEFAKIIGESSQTIKNYENKYRKPSSAFIFKLCKQFPQYTTWLMLDNQPTPYSAIITNQSINIKSTNTGNIHLDDKNSTQNNSTLRQKIIATPKNKTAYFEFLKKEFNTVYLKDLKEEELIYVLDYLESCL